MSSTLTLPKGVYHDQIIAVHGRVIDLGWRSNIIVDRCRYLIAGFMRGDDPTGIHCLKVGRGLAIWDTEPPDPPARTTQQLTDPDPFEIAIDPSQIEYLDVVGASTEGPTHRIQVTVTLGEDEPPLEGGERAYPLREFGLFGSFGGEDYMINYVRHPVIHKQADDTLTRTIRLVF